MKRTALARHTPLKRTAFKRTRKQLPADEQAVLSDFAAEFKACWRCGTTGSEWNPLDVHHISQKRRWHVRENLARLCRRCHDLYHSGFGFDVDAVCALKKKFDAAWYDREALVELLQPGKSERE